MQNQEMRAVGELAGEAVVALAALSATCTRRSRAGRSVRSGRWARPCG